MEGTGAYSIGTQIEPGLPNITGEVNIDRYNNPLQYASGAFRILFTSGAGDAGTGSGDMFRVELNASRCSAIYGASNTVQPAAYTVYYIIRLK